MFIIKLIPAVSVSVTVVLNASYLCRALNDQRDWIIISPRRLIINLLLPRDGELSLEFSIAYNEISLSPKTLTSATLTPSVAMGRTLLSTLSLPV